MSIRRFIKNRDGNFSMITALMLGPLLACLTIAIDYSELSRHRGIVQSALDATGIAAAREFINGTDSDTVEDYARSFFNTNLGAVDPQMTTLDIHFPNLEAGETEIVTKTTLCYNPYFYAAALSALGATTQGDRICVKDEVKTVVRLKSTAEIALVLDNSGSMDYTGAGSSKKRIALLKDASKQLVTILSAEARKVHQITDPMQFALVPFSSSVNIGPDKDGENWMDQYGLSPVHHENFDWSVPVDNNRDIRKDNDGIYKKFGTGWGEEEGEAVTRFTLYKDMKKQKREIVRTQEYVCTRYRSNGSCRSGYWEYHNEEVLHPPFKYASWQGCVEMRPYPMDVNDETASIANPASLYVPMFAPDEPGDVWDEDITDNQGVSSSNTYNNWWNDSSPSDNGLTRQKKANKYYKINLGDDANPAGAGQGPNQSCSTMPITPLVDTTDTAGEQSIKNAIDSMQAEGATNVTQGIAWGWRVLSSKAPFTEGRSETTRGNEKIMIVLTDGVNTYYTPQSLGKQDPAGNGSIYSSYGYTARATPGYSKTRLFQGTESPVSSSLNNTNYSEAMIQHMGKACENAKVDGITIFTIALDLDFNSSNGTGSDAKMALALKDCASTSRLDKDRKLFWNSRGNTLDDTFKAIADELSNLRIVG